MGWAARHIAELKEGKTVLFRPRGHSMTGKVDSGQLVTVEPLNGRIPGVGWIVLCKVRGSEYLHLVKAVRGDQFQIGNNRGGINGWISLNAIFGVCVDVA
jgi:hypothetical protein